MAPMAFISYLFILLVISRQNNVLLCPLACNCEHAALYCMGRNLTAIPQSIPDNLTLLLFDNNMIDTLQPLHSMELLSLKMISIAKNRIYELKGQHFHGIPDLEYLNLAENHLKEFNIANIEHLNSLFYVDLVNNEIETVNFGRLPVNFEIHLSGNPINCTCQFLKDHRLAMIKPMHGKCRFPASLENMTFSKAYWKSECTNPTPIYSQRIPSENSSVNHSPTKNAFSTTTILHLTTAQMSSENVHYVHRHSMVSSLIYFYVMISR